MFNARFVRIAVWVLAVILPGGLALLALWESARALRARSSVRPPAFPATGKSGPRLPPPQVLGT